MVNRLFHVACVLKVEIQKIFWKKILLLSSIIAFAFWMLSALRHGLLQSNAYDLGLFDQWVWLSSKGIPPYSSMEGVHLLADHGAWFLYIAALPYSLFPSIQWLLASQSFALSFTSIPLCLVALQSGLSKRNCWLICGLWWLQPVVFNVNLFDFHPEVWGMPLLALSYFFARGNKPFLWLISLFCLIGCRDGLVLIVAGIGLEQAFRRRWIWSIAALGISLSWLAMLNKFLYPLLTGTNSGPKAAASLFSYLGNTFDQIAINIFTKPNLLIINVDWLEGFVYLLLISIAIFPFWRRTSFPVLIGIIPLTAVNFLSEESPQRTLIHHYSLPIAVIVIISAIDGLALFPKQSIPWKKLIWASICWTALAKPLFFTGPYLSRVNDLAFYYQAINLVPKSAKIYTTSYLVPHLSHRSFVDFPRSSSSDLDTVDLILLNPSDPGWGSSSKLQIALLKQANNLEWNCRQWKNGLELCKSPLMRDL